MRLEFGMSYPEIAAEVGGTADAVRVMVTRAVAKLAIELDEVRATCLLNYWRLESRPRLQPDDQNTRRERDIEPLRDALRTTSAESRRRRPTRTSTVSSNCSRSSAVFVRCSSVSKIAQYMRTCRCSSSQLGSRRTRPRCAGAGIPRLRPGNTRLPVLRAQDPPRGIRCAVERFSLRKPAIWRASIIPMSCVSTERP